MAFDKDILKEVGGMFISLFHLHLLTKIDERWEAYFKDPLSNNQKNQISHHDFVIYASFTELVQILGRPTRIKGCHKTYADWIFRFDRTQSMDGMLASPDMINPRYLTLYDYKEAYYEEGDQFNAQQFEQSTIFWHFGNAPIDDQLLLELIKYTQIALFRLRKKESENHE